MSSLASASLIAPDGLPVLALGARRRIGRLARPPGRVAIALSPFDGPRIRAGNMRAAIPPEGSRIVRFLGEQRATGGEKPQEIVA